MARATFRTDTQGYRNEKALESMQSSGDSHCGWDFNVAIDGTGVRIVPPRNAPSRVPFKTAARTSRNRRTVYLFQRICCFFDHLA
jgi:hypothetical protein